MTDLNCSQEKKRAKGIFVLGSPRSGTTLLGNYIGSSKNVCNLGEYWGFYISLSIATQSLRRVRSPYKVQYLDGLRQHSAKFAEMLALTENCDWYCDATPWNLLAVDEICKALPQAVFVLSLRHYSGVMQSLKRSYQARYKWAGSTWAERAMLWRSFYYKNVRRVPKERLIVFSYDQLCQEPLEAIEKLNRELQSKGIDPSDLNLREFAMSHAPDKTKRPTIASISRDGLNFKQISSFDGKEWSKSNIDMALIQSIIAKPDRILKELFPDLYVTPKEFAGG